MSNEQLSAEQVGDSGIDLLLNLFDRMPNEYESLKETNSPVKSQQLKSLLNARQMAVKSNQIVLASAPMVDGVEQAPVQNHEQLAEQPELIPQLYDWSIKYASDDKIQEIQQSQVMQIVEKIRNGRIQQ